jgi:PBSX family phage portal protein
MSKDLDADRSALMKAAVIGDDKQMPASNVQAAEEEKQFVSIGALPPPYDPSILCMLLEHSNALRQCVDSMVANIDGFGHRFEPVLDLGSPEAEHEIRGALELRAGGKPVSDADVAAKLKEIRNEMRLEKARLDAFFESCSVDSSFVTLRRRTRQDVEVTGNGYWEVLRNRKGEGEIVQFVYIPGFTMRLLPLDRELVEVKAKVRESELGYREVMQRKRLRRYVQIFETRTVYFKEFGDPRVMSSKTGTFFKDEDTLRAKEGKDVVPATEVIHFRIHSPRSPYGVPRWIGNLLAVLGSRQAEEVNYLYFENKSVPPLAILVSGGRVSEDTVKRLQDFVEQEIKGKRNFHKMMILDADTGSGSELNSGRMKIELKPLTGAQHNDALFQNYDERNLDKIGMSFRLPRLLRGDIRDFNRSTGEAAIAFAEAQVFSPEREEFDFMLNRHVVPELGVKFWRYRSNAPSLRDPLALAPIVQGMVEAGILTPEEGRDLAEGVFNREFEPIDEEWVKLPQKLVLAGMSAGGEEEVATGAPDVEPPKEEETEPPAIDSSKCATGTKKPGQRRKLLRLPPTELRKWAETMIRLRDAFRVAEANAEENEYRVLRDEPTH